MSRMKNLLEDTSLLGRSAPRLGPLALSVPFLLIVAAALIIPAHVAPQQARAQAQPGLAEDILGQDQPQDDQPVEAVPDSVLANRIRTILTNIEDFADVRSSVVEGVVRLTGSVDQPEARRRVEELVTSLDGVVYVVNDVEAATDVQTRLTPAVNKIQVYWNGFVAQLPVLAAALIIVLIFAFVSFLISKWSRPAGWTGVNPLVWNFVNRIVRGVLVLVGLLLAFDVLGITSLMGAVLGTAGIVGLALGFAFQDIVENYLAGMLLSLRRPFGVNDLVRVGDFEGYIVRLTSREVVMLSYEGNHLRLPNAHVFKNPIINYTINPRRLFSFDVGVGDEADLQDAMRVGNRTLQSMNGVMEDPQPFARIQEIDTHVIVVRYHGWVDQRETDFLKVRSEAIRLVKSALEEADIEMPEPTYRILTASLKEVQREVVAPKPGTRKSAADDAASIDVRPDRKLDDQVREELERSDDENLLE